MHFFKSEWTEERQGGKVHTHSRETRTPPLLSFLPLSDLFLEEKGEEIRLLNSDLWNVHISSRGSEECGDAAFLSTGLFPSLFSCLLYCSRVFFSFVWFNSHCLQQKVICNVSCLLKLLT